MSRALLATMIAVLLAAHATAQEMVKDIGVGTYETWAIRLDLHGCGDRAMFLSTSPGGMTNPWITDGTLAGTRQVANLMPALSGYPRLRAAELNGDCLFLFGDSAPGWLASLSHEGTAASGLYRTDGTPEGTEQLAHCFLTDSGGPPATAGNRFYFPARTMTSTGLWVSDGTAAGTFELASFTGTAQPQNLSAFGNSVLFNAGQLSTGRELWISDGTVAGTTIVRDINPGQAAGVTGNDLHIDGGLAWFTADDGTGLALWSTDGTQAGTVRVDLPIAGDFRVVGAEAGKLFLHSADGLWVSDGTFAGTSLLGAVHVHSSSLMHNGELLFGGGATTVTYELWKSDGTPSGTLKIANAGPAQFAHPPVVAGGEVYFVASSGFELHRVDFGPAGATGASTVNPGWSGGAIVRLGTGVAQLAQTQSTSLDLWLTDGGVNTRLTFPPVVGRDLMDQHGYTSVTPEVTLAADEDGVAWMTHRWDTIQGDTLDLWRSDGTADGTKTVRSITGIDPPRGKVHRVKGNDIFETRGTGGSMVWASRKDGALAGMPELSGVPYQQVYSRIVGATGSYVFFEYYGSGIGSMLWRTNGWVSGTQFLRGFGYLGSTIDKSFVSDGVLYFSLNNGSFWRSDGTPSGTAQIGSEVRVASHSGDLNFTVAYAPTAPLHVRLGDDMFFFANRNGDAGLWASDGTVFGPRKISDLTAGPAFLPTGLGVLGSRVLFSGYSENEGYELWVSDGTVAGTELLVDLSPGAQGSHPAHFVNFKNKLYFTAVTPDKGRELWVTDGTPAGTTIVKDIAPGIQSSLPGPFVVARGSLYFTAWDPVHGAELWRSDGTPVGTRLVADIQPGMGNSTPFQLTRVGNRLFFLARTDEYGFELYTIGGGGGGGGEGCTAGTNPPGNAALLLLLVATLATMRAGLARRE